MRRALNLAPVAIAALLLSLAGPLSRKAAADGAPPAHLPWTELLTDTLRQKTLNGEYYDAQGRLLNEFANDHLVTWEADGAAFTQNRTWCNQHVALQLKHAYGWSDAYFKAKFGAVWPNAEAFYNDILAQKGFQRVNSHFDILPGDIIAISYKDDPNSSYPTFSGHVAVINGIGPMITYTFSNGTTVRFRDLEVFDSTGALHSCDSRAFQAGQLGPGSAYTEWSGAGRGWMRLFFDSSDVQLGFTWSMTGTKTQGPGTPPTWNYYSNNYKPEALRHVAIGRVTVP